MDQQMVDRWVDALQNRVLPPWPEPYKDRRIRFVRANGDKPHRCPRCHRIPDDIRTKGYARRFRTYWCSVCRVRWWMGWSE